MYNLFWDHRIEYRFNSEQSLGSIFLSLGKANKSFVKYLHLSYSKMTDFGVFHLTNLCLTNVHYLCFEGCAIGDVGTFLLHIELMEGIVINT